MQQFISHKIKHSIFVPSNKSLRRSILNIDIRIIRHHGGNHFRDFGAYRLE
ncbi:hypothetical protein THIOM_003841 [Candidatus Thiomargarita nelsonii]|uniref:Uncharacterized protein n=1 Tax=Candidatus Thiomargarita nelsonii TaxID=1003181 RepID=A0A176RXK3_9GAMM|nr:hypothetical protein THIOM_003841 [Candidatus Thiomargarita nelsonii]